MSDRPKTALVTGASSGIGVDFARLLAQRKFDLVITARRIDLLESLKKELQDEFGVEVFVIQSDLSSSAGAKQLFHDVQQLDRPITPRILGVSCLLSGLLSFLLLFSQGMILERADSLARAAVQSESDRNETD